MECELFQYSGTLEGSCTLISSNGGDTFIAAENNLIYNTGEFAARVIDLCVQWVQRPSTYYEVIVETNIMIHISISISIAMLTQK